MDKLPGISVSVVLKNGNSIDAVSGISETGILVSPDMKFGIDSITKTAIAATILKFEI
jgi:CubicO group peptidase (beta-lactamase class C family)